MEKCKIIDSQESAIERISYRMRTFIKSKNHTRVVPLIIPTGWGKTRIAVQSVKSIFLERKKEKKECTVILWPQNKTHVSKEVWKRPSDWSEKFEPSASKECVLGWNPLFKPSDEQFVYITGSSLIDDKLYKKSIDKTRGPIFFIIDEWHSKKIVSQYIEFKEKCKLKNHNKIAEIFWRKLLLQGKIDEKRLIEKKGKKRRLFVLLVSATPIASTQHMDEIRFDSFKDDLQNVLEAFNELISVGNNRGGEFYKSYPDLIDKESKKLSKEQQKYKSQQEYSNIIQDVPSLEKWAKEYVERSKILHEKEKYKIISSKEDYDPQIYMKEQALFCGLYPQKNRRQKEDPTLTKYDKITAVKHRSLKEKTLISLLKYNENQKFVVFCHHIGIAKHLEEMLNEFFHKKDFAYYLKKNEFDAIGFKQFNNSQEYKTRVLIVTDKHSQGVSLHESAAWLVHYELSWNPIRIIQRFGRVWRLLNGKITSPIAFCMPYTYSSEEEQIRRLEKRWDVLALQKEELKLKKEVNGMLKHIDISPIPMKVALGIRITPSPYKDDNSN